MHFRQSLFLWMSFWGRFSPPNSTTSLSAPAAAVVESSPPTSVELEPLPSAKGISFSPSPPPAAAPLSVVVFAFVARRPPKLSGAQSMDELGCWPVCRLPEFSFPLLLCSRSPTGTAMMAKSTNTARTATQIFILLEDEAEAESSSFLSFWWFESWIAPSNLLPLFFLALFSFLFRWSAQ